MGAVLIGVFVASAVEVIEMSIIVVGVGAARGWRSTLIGGAAGMLVLAALAIGLGQALSLIPIDVVRVVIGALLLTFGLQWLRKGIVRVSSQGFWGGGAEESAAEAGGGGAIDWTAFVLSFKGVLLEGLEIAFIVVAFGAGNGGGSSYFQAAIGAIAAFLLIGAVAIWARSRLEAVPGRTLKFAVGGLLTTFGTYWAMEGLGVHWPAAKLSLAWLYAAYLLAAFVYLWAVRRGLLGPAPPATGAGEGNGVPAASRVESPEEPGGDGAGASEAVAGGSARGQRP